MAARSVHVRPPRLGAERRDLRQRRRVAVDRGDARLVGEQAGAHGAADEAARARDDDGLAAEPHRDAAIMADGVAARGATGTRAPSGRPPARYYTK